jgi:hypothetical protein
LFATFRKTVVDPVEITRDIRDLFRVPAKLCSPVPNSSACMALPLSLIKALGSPRFCNA